MKKFNFAEPSIKICTALLIFLSVALTFTVSDYYIFNRVAQYGVTFVICQWIKKAGLLTLPLAVFYKKKSCSDISKLILPPFVIVSCFTFGKFFDATAVTADSSPAELVYAHINEFIPKTANIAMFFISNSLYLVICAYLFWRDGFKVSSKSFKYLPIAIIACAPLNIFENFFDIASIPENHFLRFGNFTVWHFLAIAALVLITALLYGLLKDKDRRTQDEYLAALAAVLLIQYHSKDSVVIGDGYNVYNTVFACVPLFICNIGVYVCSLAVLVKRKPLYAISFFVHAAGACSVFLYFAREDVSDYGICCSYSILFFVLTHCILFALSVLPTALGHYKFSYKDCIIPLVYYYVIIIIASVSSALVTSASMGFKYNGYTLAPNEWIYPNYAFTQQNPLPFTVPNVGITVWRCELNVLYLLGLYAFYVGIFFAFNFACRIFSRVRKAALNYTSTGPPCP